ncbi:MAG: hypothetical protein COV66_15255 [Nitrospinae bacterium CG11_big_fil_rev_8_21_14_0_20_45_15]|nr:MAG: hypothetical protein COV66_15255 [Nitrospinae bacterium CG11_big_fil_rev_8_21_14_0_20_45_15]
MENETQWVKEILRKIDIFTTLEDDELEDLVAQMAYYQFKKGQTIIKQGEPSDFFFVVHEGVVKVLVKKFLMNKEVNTLTSGDFFGEMALLTHSKRRATLVAQETTSCFVLFKSSFQYTVNKNPFFKTRMQAIVKERSKQLNKA